ncbi:MAG: hypothetical protein WDZ52_15055, partial [Pseudohongiellaceae bacterium]
AQIASQESLAHLSQAETEAVNLKDDASKRISEFLAKAQATSATPVQPAVKQTQVIKPSTLSKKAYLESSEDIDQFLDELRRELNAALASDKRIEIR